MPSPFQFCDPPDRLTIATHRDGVKEVRSSDRIFGGWIRTSRRRDDVDDAHVLAGAAKDVNGIIKITRLVDLHGTCLCQVVDADANRWENLTNEAGVWTGEAGPATPDVADRVAGRADPSGDNRKFAALDSDDLNVGASTGDPPAGTLIDRSNDWHST